MTDLLTPKTHLRLDGPAQSYVRLIADSLSADSGDRVTSFEINGWRFTLAEWNTHSIFNRNSASSRAIPVEKQLVRYHEAPALPVSWPAEKPGMQGGEALVGDNLLDAEDLFEDINHYNFRAIDRYLTDHPDKSTRLHKSLLNRLLEPMQWHCMLVTASSFENFFEQRVSPDAQPELRVCAELMQQLYLRSEPVELKRGQWHTPYVSEAEAVEITAGGFDPREVSTARCARISYLSQNGQRDFIDDVTLCRERLLPSRHMSPFAHICTPEPRNIQWVPIMDPDTGRRLGERRLPKMGHYVGWQEYRHVIEGRIGRTSQR